MDASRREEIAVQFMNTLIAKDDFSQLISKDFGVYAGKTVDVVLADLAVALADQLIKRLDECSVSEDIVFEYINHEDAVLLKRIDDESSEFSTHTANYLKSINIFYIGDLVQLKETDFLGIHIFSEKTMQTIKNDLKRYGLSLGMKLNENQLNQLKHEHLKGAAEKGWNRW